MKLVDDANLVWEKWSVRLHAINLAFLGVAASFQGPLKSAWENLPDGIRSLFPTWVVFTIGGVLMISGLIAAYIDQPKLQAKRDAQS